MRHVIIASHHRFAEGLADTLEFIGGVENMRAVCAYVDETPLEEQVAAAFASVAPDDEVLVLTDILQRGASTRRLLPLRLATGSSWWVSMLLCALSLPFCRTPFHRDYQRSA